MTFSIVKHTQHNMASTRDRYGMGSSSTRPEVSYLVKYRKKALFGLISRWDYVREEQERSDRIGKRKWFKSQEDAEEFVKTRLEHFDGHSNMFDPVAIKEETVNVMEDDLKVAVRKQKLNGYSKG